MFVNAHDRSPPPKHILPFCPDFRFTNRRRNQRESVLLIQSSKSSLNQFDTFIKKVSFSVSNRLQNKKQLHKKIARIYLYICLMHE